MHTTMEEVQVVERRKNIHRESLVDVGLVLKKHYGSEYARDFLLEVRIPEELANRLLASDKVRRVKRSCLIKA